MGTQDAAIGLTPLDIACAMPLGTEPGARLPPATEDIPVAEVVDRACARLFADGLRIFVGFSGGRESSMHLAVVTDYARRHGHALPIPVTLVHPRLGVSRAAQEAVVRHLGLPDWERVEVDDLDLVGSLATRMLEQIGPFWPAHGYMMVPLFERARGAIFELATGTMDFFSFWRWAPLAGVLARQRRPTSQDLALLLATLLPATARARLARRRGIPPPMPWLRPDAERRALAMLTGRQAQIPIRFDRAVMTQVTHRCFGVGWRTMQALGRVAGTTVAQPLYTPETIAAFARAGSWRGFGTRGQTMRRFAGHLLPAGALAGSAESETAEAFFGEATRAFARDWDGSGLDDTLVDAEMLRRIWLGDEPDSRTACLLQYAWRASRGWGVLRAEHGRTSIVEGT